jgi:phosphomannomutase
MGEEWEDLDEDVLGAYLDRIAALVSPTSPRELRTVYTPLHGVGRDVVLAAFDRAGFSPPYVVSEQGDPDPEFRTVAFPNPEEPGAIDMAVAAAHAEDVDIVLANDPDADRCAVAVPDAASPSGWRMLRGDEVGALLAQHLIRRDPELTGTFATSIVSSSLLGKIAAAHGLGYQETLTGFKWISRVPGLRFGYEEALGYCVDPDFVRDKDGVSAAILVAELAAVLKAEGRSLTDLLDDLARDYGLHATDQLSARFDDLADIDAAMARLRKEPPTALGGRDVTDVEDLTVGVRGLPPTDGLCYHLVGGCRVIVRPSGTEPKVKCYLEVVIPVVDGDVAAAREKARSSIAATKQDIARAAGLPG